MSDSLTVPDASGTVRSRALPGLLAGAAAVGIAAWNPGDNGVTVCISKGLLNLDCPLCGGLRAVNSLMRGDFLAAADHNVFVAVGVPIVAVTWIVWILSSALGRPFTLPKVPNWLIGSFAAAMLAFTVVRNVGGPTWATWLASGVYR
ncbi:MAG: DUF2752 domain-containing protein [Microthrixaceae bacterium]